MQDTLQLEVIRFERAKVGLQGDQLGVDRDEGIVRHDGRVSIAWGQDGCCVGYCVIRWVEGRKVEMEETRATPDLDADVEREENDDSVRHC